MLSVCIPIYNFPISNLVESLHREATELAIPFEILLIDDASTNSFRELNKNLSNLDNVTYIQLDENIGRSKIRNLLAQNANYENLIFLDCDVSLVDELFLKRYIDVMDNCQIVSGGRIYTDESPVNCYFHWYYGVNREVKSGNFMSNNFLIKRDLWSKVKFNETISKYGHEDTLFQIELERIGIAIEKIDNPVVHIGLDNNLAFLSKSEICIENSLFILSNMLINNKELKYFRLLSTYKTVSKLKLNSVFSFLYNLAGEKIRTFLIRKPNLFLFDLYKLLYICNIAKKSS